MNNAAGIRAPIGSPQQPRCDESPTGCGINCGVSSYAEEQSTHDVRKLLILEHRTACPACDSALRYLAGYARVLVWRATARLIQACEQHEICSKLPRVHGSDFGARRHARISNAPWPALRVPNLSLEELWTETNCKKRILRRSRTPIHACESNQLQRRPADAGIAYSAVDNVAGHCGVCATGACVWCKLSANIEEESSRSYRGWWEQLSAAHNARECVHVHNAHNV